MDPQRTLVIVNPAARNGQVGRDWTQLQALLESALGPCHFEHTQRAGHAAEMAHKAALGSDFDTVLSMGGDGTHGDVINGLMNAQVSPDKIAFGPLPTGTGGDFCRLIEGDRDLEATAKALRASKGTLIDVGEAIYQGLDGKEASRYFLNMASCGMNGLVDKLVNTSSKRLGGKLSFFLATARARMVYKPVRADLLIDGETVGQWTIDSICACNGRFAGGGMLFAPNASLNDGLLDVVVTAVASFPYQLRMMQRVYEGTHDQMDHIHTFRGAHIEVRPLMEKAYMDIDGEYTGIAPAQFIARPSRLTLLGLKSA